MDGPATPPSLWVRVIADDRFRAALINDPLRALAEAGELLVSPEQVRQLEDLEIEERRELITRVVQEAYLKGAQARFGRLHDDGRGRSRAVAVSPT